MRKIAFLFCLISMALCFTSCDDKDFAEDGDMCDNIGETFCKSGLLFACEHDPDFMMMGNVYEWHSYQCDRGSYCHEYSGKADCYEKCTAADEGMRHPDDPRMICTRTGKNEYFFVY